MFETINKIFGNNEFSDNSDASNYVSNRVILTLTIAFGTLLPIFGVIGSGHATMKALLITAPIGVAITLLLNMLLNAITGSKNWYVRLLDAIRSGKEDFKFDFKVVVLSSIFMLITYNLVLCFIITFIGTIIGNKGVDNAVNSMNSGLSEINNSIVLLQEQINDMDESDTDITALKEQKSALESQAKALEEQIKATDAYRPYYWTQIKHNLITGTISGFIIFCVCQPVVLYLWCKRYLKLHSIE